jgi:CxxC motif-containing protein
MDKVPQRKPTQTCKVDTPVGEIEGKKCPLGDELYHRTRPDYLSEIVRDGEIDAGEQKHTLGKTGVVSMSSNPAHSYGGTVRLVIDPDKVEDEEPMCYYDSDEMDRVGELEEKIKGEDPTIAPNVWRAKYGIQPIHSYGDECEYFSRDDVPVEAIEKIEYWYPWDRPDIDVACENKGPKYARGSEWGTDHLESNKVEIRSVKKDAEAPDVPFEVKSCFKWLRKPKYEESMSSQKEWCKLDEENLENLEKGEPLECQDDKPEVFEEGPISEHRDPEKLKKVCRC